MKEIKFEFKEEFSQKESQIKTQNNNTQ